ncbi:hypothetical protein N9F34_02105 [Alphaproteobacteria bacterium]|nr:hypothetical protein [Alphaproteobacteria bacterium]
MWRQRHPAVRFPIIYLGLDRFKLVNESLGYVHGDDELVILLEEVATTGDAKNTLESL